MSSAGRALKVPRRRSRATPARLLTSPATTSTGIDDRTMRRSCGSEDRAPATIVATATAASTQPRLEVTRPMPSRPVAR